LLIFEQPEIARVAKVIATIFFISNDPLNIF